MIKPHYQCPVCGAKIERDLVRFLSHAEDHVIEVIKKQHPEWVSHDGVCDKCLDYYRRSLNKKGPKPSA